MVIGVLIKRVTRHCHDARVILPHRVELRALEIRQPGYFSGEAFFYLRSQRRILGETRL